MAKEKKNTVKKDNKTSVVENINVAINKLKDNKFTFNFFVIDTKGNPNGSLAYTYETALCLKNLGYNVRMLHAEQEFVGVESWLGKEYASLEHANIEKDGVAISPADFLFIPEIYSNVMYKTFEQGLPCKRVALLTNFRYLTEIIQPGVTWADYGINECVTTSSTLEDKITSVFGNLKTHVVKPFISDDFKGNGTPKKLVINIVSENKSDVNRIVKEFFWKYPSYKWVTFQDVRGVSHEKMKDLMKGSFATIWVDEKTDFGYSALEAMKAGNIVIAKVPEDPSSWIVDTDGNLKDNAVWFYNMNNVHDIIAGVIQSFIHNNLPAELFKNVENTVNDLSYDNFKKSVEKVYVEGLKEDRIKEITTLLSIYNKNEEEIMKD